MNKIVCTTEDKHKPKGKQGKAKGQTNITVLLISFLTSDRTISFCAYACLGS